MNHQVELRPYQQDAVDAVEQAWGRGKSPCLVALPTGTGKTIVFAHLIRRMQERCPGRPALVLAHRDELVAQAEARIREVIPSAPTGWIKAERDEWDAPVVVGSVQTLARNSRLEHIPAGHYGLVVVDEAHHATARSYRRILKRARLDEMEMRLMEATAYRIVHYAERMKKLLERRIRRKLVEEPKEAAE